MKGVMGRRVIADGIWRAVLRCALLATVTLALGAAASAQATPAGDWHLDRVVVVMRHGVRPPTKAEPLPASIPHQPWPAWDVGWGELTHHGEQAVALLGAFDRARYLPLLGTSCPAAGEVHAVADTDQRTMRTAEVYVAALFPACAVPVEHLPAGATDPRFSPFDGAPLLSPEAALAAANAALPADGSAGLDRRIAPQLQALDRIIACGGADCALAGKPTAITMKGGSIKLAGGLGTGASLAETLALEYADGKPLAEVGWGRVSRAAITDLLALHTAEFAITARRPAIAQVGAHALLAEVATALASEQGPRFSLFLGHDTNLALIGGALGLHWHAAQFAPDDPPPGGALIFERWSNGAGKYRLHVVFRSQTLDEMRDLAPSGAAAVTLVAFAPCSAAEGCSAAELGQAVLGTTR